MGVVFTAVGGVPGVGTPRPTDTRGVGAGELEPVLGGENTLGFMGGFTGEALKGGVLPGPTELFLGRMGLATSGY